MVILFMMFDVILEELPEKAQLCPKQCEDMSSEIVSIFHGAAADLLSSQTSATMPSAGVPQNHTLSFPSIDHSAFNTLIPPMTNTTGDKVCGSFEHPKHFLMQGANLCFAAAFLVPHRRFQFGILGMRILLSVGFLLGSLWARLLACGPDILAWSIILFLVNLTHVGYLLYKYCPPRIAPDLLELYIKLFTTVKVKKKHFKDLIKDADILTLDPNEHYAMEGITSADQRLSILLSGRMKATCEDVLLHYIMPYEFIDSPEWESCRNDSDKLFQVTLTALESCRLITWRRHCLESLLANNRFLDVVMYNLIGKDITHKLYSLNDHHGKGEDTKASCVGLPELWRHQQMSKSLSVDAVHTGTKGRVRSIMWRDPERRASVAESESMGSSPIRTPRCFVHYSDPGPERSPTKHSNRSVIQFQEEYPQAERKPDERS